MGTDREKAMRILRKYPEARNSYKVAMFKWWREYDGLIQLILDIQAGKGFTDIFKRWFVNKATPPHTIRNRIQEVQNEYPRLDAREEVEEWRQKRSRQGVVR